ncbi:MAG: hypothetical protein PQJ61_05650 [Spirochaetales bacterium]|uniref:Uncharacterized protein n=1 Tax=Candidatus Thalassospirochaeta sargassi TaxID=3119039 RepID=A0AAJ1IBN7_9SPIO|nr:hypothetical protein [Spirochaetales bacterium]
MAKSRPEIYNPGDLDRTRNNLGELSKEEADRMASILGGEVGFEKTDEALKQKYDHLKKVTSSHRPSGKGSGGGSRKAGEPSAAASSEKKQKPHSDAYTGHYNRKKTAKTKPGYFDRIKIDRMAARPEHRVKSRSDLFSAYFSFLIKRKDKVNPDFILEGDTFYYSHIENLETKLKSLLKQLNPGTFKLYINPYYRDILKILISWDLKEMSSILSDLQKSPRNREIRDCGRLCFLIYEPIISLSQVDIKHIYAAVDRLYKVLQLLYSEDPEELVNIKNRYLDVKEKIKIVLKDIAFTCYPLLLKLTGTRFHYYREFMNRKRDLILNYLKIDEDSLVIPPENLQELGKKQYSLNHLKQKLEKEREEQLKKMKREELKRDEKEISNALVLLERIFPESGWSRQNEFPDYYPYFHPLFKFPKGTELIPAEDPLQQVVVLASIIQDLLYGFRSISIVSDHKKEIEKTTDKWHLFIDEMIQKNYNKLLIEYCRNIEKGVDYSTSKFGQKLLTDIYWFKRKFILPFMKFKILYKSETIPLKAPKFHEQVSNFYRTLKALMEEFDNSKERQKLISNYSEPFHFEIKNITSYRLGKILAKDNIAPTNENLLRYSLMLVSLLDFLINTEASPFYQRNTEEIPVYRYDPVYQGKPLYSVTLIDTEALLKKYQG